MEKQLKTNESGFSLIGILVLLVTLSIAVSVALETITPALEESRRVETEAALHAIGQGIAGNYALGGTMSGAEFGYVGDVGSMPTSLSSLQTNPGSYSTWNGPYLRDEFIEATNKSITDRWGTSFAYTGGVTVTSSGSGSSMTYTVAKSTTDLLNCGFTGIIQGANGATPGANAGNLSAIISYPNGTGGMTTTTVTVSSAGVFNFTSGLPVGIRTVKLKDNVALDSVTSYVQLLPRSSTSNTSVGTLRLPTKTY